MTRLPPITRDDADDTQRDLWDAIAEPRGGSASLTGPDGALIGPFNAMLTSPDIGAKVTTLGAGLRFASSVERRLLELAIVTVGAHWKAEFEFWAHSRMAIDAGIAQSVVDDLAAGRTPSFTNADEAAVHHYAHSLVTTGRVDQDTYDQVQAAVGDQALVDLTTTIGYYCLISLTLNAFEVPLPDGVEPVWDAP
jgi:4-carboxymuconolactone decarboxylase